ncbi:MAG: ABC transporter permease, partial [Pyrinomonadaceae bacterium]
MAANPEPIKGSSPWRDAWKRLRKNRLAVLGLCVLALMTIAVIVGPSVVEYMTGFTYDYIPQENGLARSFPPSLQHLMGTDDAGRDLLARVLQGGRVSLMVGVI